jgi:hypothetical protein
MARQKPTDEIEALRRQQADLQVRLKAAEQRQKKQQLEENNRRKVLLGGILIKYLSAHPDTEITHAIANLISKQNLPAADRKLLSALFSTEEPIPETKKSGPGNNAGAA